MNDAVDTHFEAVYGANFEEQKEDIKKALKEAGIDAAATAGLESIDDYKKLLAEYSAKVAEHPLVRNQLLGVLDMLWMTNLEDLEALAESVGLRAYGQRDPLVEYRQEASRLFKGFWNNFNGLVFANIFKLLGVSAQGGGTPAHAQQAAAANASSGEKIGRNDPCSCGSGKKYKKCGLLNTEEHQKFMAKKAGGKHEVIGG